MGEPENLFDTIIKALEYLSMGKGAELLSLTRWWKEIVGDYVAKHTTPLRFSDGALVVGVDNNALMQQLSLEQERIKENMEKVLGKSWPLRFVYHRKSTRRTKAPRIRDVKLSEEEIKEIKRMVEKVKDPELRLLFEKAIIGIELRRRQRCSEDSSL